MLQHVFCIKNEKLYRNGRNKYWQKAMQPSRMHIQLVSPGIQVAWEVVRALGTGQKCRRLVGWIYGYRTAKDVVRSEELFWLVKVVGDTNALFSGGVLGNVEIPMVQVTRILERDRELKNWKEKISRWWVGLKSTGDVSWRLGQSWWNCSWKAQLYWDNWGRGGRSSVKSILKRNRYMNPKWKSSVMVLLNVKRGWTSKI